MEVDMDETDRILKDLLAKLTEEKRQRERQRKAREKPRLVRYGLREHEAESWLDQEPSYDKWIFKSRYDKLTEWLLATLISFSRSLFTTSDLETRQKSWQSSS